MSPETLYFLHANVQGQTDLKKLILFESQLSRKLKPHDCLMKTVVNEANLL